MDGGEEGGDGVRGFYVRTTIRVRLYVCGRRTISAGGGVMEAGMKSSPDEGEYISAFQAPSTDAPPLYNHSFSTCLRPCPIS